MTIYFFLFHFNCYCLWVLFVTAANHLPQITYWHSKGSVCLHKYITKFWALNLLKKSLCTCSIVPWKNTPPQKYLTTITWKVLELQVTELCRLTVYMMCCFIFWQGWTLKCQLDHTSCCSLLLPSSASVRNLHKMWLLTCRQNCNFGLSYV
jgi:hypothetical protein